jgi:Ala-tRNA(Pro) deacylase
MPIPTRLVDFLDRNDIHYDVMRHAAAYTAQELAAAEHVKGRYHAKVVVLKSGAECLLAVVPADHRVNLDRLSRLVGRPVELVEEAEFDRIFPDCARGTMPPFGALYNLQTYVDRALTFDPFIVFEAGTHTEAIRMEYADFARLAKPRVADFAEKLH